MAIAPIYATAYLLSPYDLLWHVSSSVDRLLLQVMPTVVTGAALALAAADEHRADREIRSVGGKD